MYVKRKDDQTTTMNKPPDIYKCIKADLRQVVKPGFAVEKLLEAVSRAHAILREASFLLKDYVLSDPETNIPKINSDFLDMVFQSVCERPKTGRSKTTFQTVYDDLVRHYDTHILPEHDGGYRKPSYKHLNTILDYAAITWMTSIENNIKQRYVTYVEKYVNHHFDRVSTLNNIKSSSKNTKERDNMKTKFLRRLRTIKVALLTVDGSESNCSEQDEIWVKKHRLIVLPDKTTFEKDSIFYDVHCQPLDYLLPMLRIMKTIEASDKEEKPTLNHVLPTKPTLIPGHVRIDTTTLSHLTGFKPKSLEELKHVVWDEHFRTDKRTFQMKGYRFNNSIMTDGVSCSILFIKNEFYGRKKIKTHKEPTRERYLDDLSQEELNCLKNRNIVGIDPNMWNLLYCIDGKGHTLRYTNGRRNVDMAKEKYRTYNEERKKTIVGEGRTVVEWETTLSHHESKTTLSKTYKEYLRQRFKVDEGIGKFYEEIRFRKIRLHSYRNRKNSENTFVSRFKKTYGDDAIVCIGDWEQKQHRKYKEPVKGKGLRKMFTSNGLAIYLIDEHTTSNQCWGCKNDEAILEKFKKRTYRTKKGEQRTSALLHGLLKCTTCKRLWNRDANAAMNQRDIAQAWITDGIRPNYLERKHLQIQV